MRVDELDFDLPEALIAQAPPERRDGGRLLALDPVTGALAHQRVTDLPSLVAPALFVANDTRVIPARLLGTKPTGGRVELLLLRCASRAPDGQIESWRALARGTRALRPGMPIALEGEGLGCAVREVLEGGEVEVRLEARTGESVRAALERVGHVPLPPYIRRADSADDRARYQTVFAAHDGSIAAPTAGLHFTEALLAALTAAGHRLAHVTLHVGLGTFAPLRVDHLDAHVMHTERYDVPEATVRAVEAARAEGRAVIAIGTTVCRALESAAVDGTLRAGPGETALLIRPPYRFRAIDGLFTNFHLPRSTLLALVMALGGVAQVRTAYAAAVAERYRFFSYGDAMLVRPRAEGRR